MYLQDASPGCQAARVGRALKRLASQDYSGDYSNLTLSLHADESTGGSYTSIFRENIDLLPRSKMPSLLPPYFQMPLAPLISHLKVSNETSYEEWKSITDMALLSRKQSQLCVPSGLYLSDDLPIAQKMRERGLLGSQANGRATMPDDALSAVLLIHFLRSHVFYLDKYSIHRRLDLLSSTTLPEDISYDLDYFHAFDLDADIKLTDIQNALIALDTGQPSLFIHSSPIHANSATL